MDERLDLLKGHQAMHLTADDAPLVAKAMTACIRRQGYIGTVQVNNISMVRMYGVGFDVYVLGDDWLKIAPYFVDGTLNPLIVGYQIPNADPRLDVATIDLQDQSLYQKIEGLLLMLFPTKYPRSNI